MMTKTQLNKLIKMMNDLDYPFEAPLKESFIESIIQIEFNSNSTNCLEKLCNEVSIIFKNQPDYLTFLRAMDGFELMDYDYLASRFQNLQLKTFLP